MMTRAPRSASGLPSSLCDRSSPQMGMLREPCAAMTCRPSMARSTSLRSKKLPCRCANRVRSGTSTDSWLATGPSPRHSWSYSSRPDFATRSAATALEPISDAASKPPYQNVLATGWLFISYIRQLKDAASMNALVQPSSRYFLVTGTRTPLSGNPHRCRSPVATENRNALPPGHRHEGSAAVAVE
jgi:hypothetical protein